MAGKTLGQWARYEDRNLRVIILGFFHTISPHASDSVFFRALKLGPAELLVADAEVDPEMLIPGEVDLRGREVMFPHPVV